MVHHKSRKQSLTLVLINEINQGSASLNEMHILYLQQTMTADTGLSKEEDEEEDDTMQNTVVLFSNTDKFVLQQVRI